MIDGFNSVVGLASARADIETHSAANLPASSLTPFGDLSKYERLLPLGSALHLLLAYLHLEIGDTWLSV